MPSIPHTDDPVLLFIAERVNSLGENLFDLNANVAAYHAEHTAFKTDMVGNGQPGRIQRIETAHEDLGKKVTKIDRKLWYASGALLAAGTFLKYLAGKLFPALGH